MNIGEEKEVLYAMMKEITQERRKLTDIYFSLKQRVDKLNEIETIGLSELNTKDYVEAFNKNNLQTIRDNLERETKRIVENLEQHSSPVQESLIPKEVIAESKERDARITSGSLPLEKVGGIIARVLKENGVPMSVSNLYEVVNKRADGRIKINNFRNNILPRIIRTNKNIERATRGFYQYNSNK